MPISYKNYPPNWKTEIRPAILKRAGEIKEGKKIVREAKCEFCGIENHSIKINGKKIVITIAHLDNDPHNKDVSYDRLSALCQKCHLGYDREYHIKNRKNKKITPPITKK